MKTLGLLFALLVALPGFAQPLALPAPPQAQLTQRLGASLPLSLPLVDEAGRAVTLRDFFEGGRPVLLVPGYYSCPELCGLLIHGLLEGVHDARLGPGDVRILRVSIDPQDSARFAAAQRSRDLAYAQFLHAPTPDLHLLLGARQDTAALARAVGYTFEAARDGDAPAARFAHPATVVVVTPRGRVSRYLTGVRFDPAELRAAVDSAAQEHVGTLTDRLALLCAHFDPRVGRHSEAVMNSLRAVGLLTLAALGGWCWRRRGAGAGP